MFHSRQFNQNIFATNQYILSRCNVFHFSYFECNFFLSREMFTRHGLHLHSSGKLVFCEKLSNVILSSHRTPAFHGFILPDLPSRQSDFSELCNNTDILLTDISCPLLSDTMYDIPLIDITDHTPETRAESPNSTNSISFFPLFPKNL
uniref:Uncharacterized protein n=1 Tax=Cacopsylla melanoneura TaxID=428564 RepID=A0A8D8TSZ6_9HEMI